MVLFFFFMPRMFAKAKAKRLVNLRVLVPWWQEKIKFMPCG